MSKLTAIVFFVLAVAQSCFAQAAPQMMPAEIFARVSSVYSTCRTYADEGELSTVINGRGPGSAQHFSTVFARPDKFRFEFRPATTNPAIRFTAWRDRSFEFSDSLGDVRQEETGEALIRLFWISGGSSVTVPALLLPEAFSGRGLFASFKSVKFVGEDKVDNRRAFKIHALLDGDPFLLWIDADQFLILKVEQKLKMGSADLRVTTKYRPVLNAEISPERLAFNPRDTDFRVPDEPPPAIREANPPVAPRLKSFGSSVHLTSQQIERFRKQRELQPEEEDVVRVDTDLVVSDVLVVDREGRAIDKLRKEDFMVKEDDQPQEISSFSLGNSNTLPRSIVLIIDYSNSQLPYVITSVDAAKKLVDQLNPGDRMAVVTDDVQLLIDFTSDKQVLKSQLEALKQRAMKGWVGRSRQYDALMATLNELFRSEDERPVIIFQTDGDQLSALGAVPPAGLQPYMPDKKFSFEDLLAAAERVRVTIYSIIPGVPFVGRTGDDLLAQAKLDWENRRRAREEIARLRNLPIRQLSAPPDEILIRSANEWNRLHLGVAAVANVTGGWSNYLQKPEQADDLYARILNDMNRRYVIAYYPKNRTRDGKRRRLSIEVRGHPEYIVVGRKSYLAPQP